MHHSKICNCNCLMSKFLCPLCKILCRNHSAHFTHVCMGMKLYSFLFGIVFSFNHFRLYLVNFLCIYIVFSGKSVYFKSSCYFYPVIQTYFQFSGIFQKNPATYGICIISNYKVTFFISIFCF